MHNTESYVWYACYGSNLNKQRFLCYIVGGTPEYGKKYNKGCKNKNCPIEDRPCNIPHRLYFALPEGETETDNWGPGGVAFITPAREENEEHWTKGRMWRITSEQYVEVRNQESRDWYNYEILLGKEKGMPIYTITNGNILANIKQPSEAYLKTMISGLREIRRWSDEILSEYLMKKAGIKGFEMDKLMGLIESTIDG